MDQFGHIGWQKTTRRRVMQGAVALAGSGLLGASLSRVALAQGKAGILPQAVYAATEYAFDGPAQLPAGLNRLIMRNDGAMEHHAMFLKLAEGKTPADVEAAAQQGLGELLAIAPSAGGPGSIGPGRAATAVLDLEPGNYLVVCLIPDEDGVPHMAKGMILPVQVVAAADATPTAEVEAPTADVTIEMADFSFSGLPETVSAGSKVWAVTNVGAQLHEIVIYQLANGVTREQVEAMFGITGGAAASPMAGMDMGAGTPAAEASPAAAAPITAVTGMAPMSPGMTGWIQFDLSPGEYVAICFVPDPASGAPHYMLGMISFFTVE